MLNLQTVEYMEQMNQNIDDKMRMLDWIKGQKVLDAGCGGGELTQRLNNLGYDAYGIDLSLLSWKELSKRGLRHKFIHGNLLDMSLYFDKDEFDTIIFSSVLHEVYSYNGFYLGNVVSTIKNALKIIRKGGRIIIRDGVMSDSNEKRIIRFKDINDVCFLTEYCRRFKGRKVKYKMIDKLTFEMNINDAMEFLYTYTWGWDSFDREVQEQFGVMTLRKYISLVRSLGGKVIHAEEYLQDGYVEHLSKKIDFFDKDMNPTKLPNSTMLLVIEK
jgi:2-polyprenyl-3-methyl-5-hydroxy-6-metoxy-1,4-benzoquinol methylase